MMMTARMFPTLILLMTMMIVHRIAIITIVMSIINTIIVLSVVITIT